MRIVCLCGSIRFKQSFLAAEEAEARAGNVVLAPVFFSQSERRRLTHGEIEALHLLHRQKIDMADELLVVAPNGYVGESTTSEIEYGRQLGKPIRYWQDNAVGAESFDPVAALRESYEAQRLGISQIPTLNVPAAVKELRCALIEEETRELRDALEAEEIVEVADAIAGLLYVVYGAAITFGIPVSEVLAEVHRSNMTKLYERGAPVVRADGKVLKGPKYSAPDLLPLLRNAGFAD